MENNIQRMFRNITAASRESLLRQKGCVIWLTGLSGSGKSSIANQLEVKLHSLGKSVYILDGDNVRHGLNSDLGFSDGERVENIRRIGEVAALFADAAIITIVSFISPFRKDRETARKKVPAGRFFEVFVNAPLKLCEERDPKGLYKKARRGEILDFTGINSPYEIPISSELEVDTGALSIEESADKIIDLLTQKRILCAE